MKYVMCVAWILGVASLAHAVESSSSTTPSPIADWSLIESYGGIELGPAIQHTTSSWKMGLICDLSAHNSGIVIRRTVVTQEDNSIYLSLEISHTAWTMTPERGQCQPVVLESKPGLHTVYYRDAAGKTYPLGHVDFHLDSNVLNTPPG
jgi:hypothetical protein